MPKPVKSIFDTEDEEDPFIADFDHRYWDHIMQAINLPSKPAFDNEEWIYVMEAFRSALKAETEREYLDGADPNAADFWYEQGDDVLSTDIETVLRLKAEERLSDATSDLLVANTVSFQDQPLDDSSSANPPSGDGMPASMETVLSDAPEPGFSVGGHQVPSKILSSPSAVSTDDAIVLGLHHLWI